MPAPVREGLDDEQLAVIKATELVNKNGKGPHGDYATHPAFPDITIAIELISPEMARTWLDRGGNNRKKSERSVLRLQQAIQIGEWKMTGEAIQLDKDGKVRNGQHRLEAISRGTKSVYAIVVRGIEEDAFDVIDTGKSRSAADVLGIHGHTQTIAKATAARGLILIERHGRFSVGSTRIGTSPAPSNAAILAYIEAHPEIEEAVKMADRLRVNAGFVGGSGLWAIAFTYFLRINAEQAEVFCNSLIEGANLEAGSPILKLRNAYKGGMRDWHSTTENRERLLATVIKGWNAWRQDRVVQALVWHDKGRAAESFPVAE